VLYDRLNKFGVDESKVFIPTDTLHLDNEASYKRMANFVVKHNIGLVILDSAHGFYTLRDKQLNQLRGGFQALIDAGAAVVILSHIVKSKRPDEIDAAQGAGLPEACDFTLSVYKSPDEQIRLKPIKRRHPKGVNREEVIVIYDGESRMSSVPTVTLEDQILQFITDAGEKGTNLGALRDLAGKDNIKAALASLDGKYYCDGKRGPGNHIWDLKYKPEVLSEDSVTHLDDDNSFSDDEDEVMVVAA
jgi:hypothetical protein